MIEDSKKASVIVISDRCYQGTETDRSGAAIRARMIEAGYAVDQPAIVPDEIPLIEEKIEEALNCGSRLIITSGSTGIGTRDVAPEATSGFIATPLLGLQTLLTMRSLEQTEFAAFSRGLAGISSAEGRQAKALIVNVAGSVKAALNACQTLLPLLPHFFDQLDPKGFQSSSVDGSSKMPYTEHPVIRSTQKLRE